MSNSTRISSQLAAALSCIAAVGYLGIALAYLQSLVFGQIHPGFFSWITGEPFFHWTKWVSATVVGAATIGWLPLLAERMNTHEYPMYRWVTHLFVVAVGVTFLQKPRPPV